MEVLFDYIRTGLVFLVVITVLVGVHELGHFWFARLFGMKVDAFAIMMGGIRKTDLTEHLGQPMAPARTVWLVVAVTTLAVIICGVGKFEQGYWATLFFLSVPIPLWVASRLQNLYHLPQQRGFRTVFTSWAVAVTVVLVSSGGRGVEVGQILAVLFFASMIALMLVYYHPVLNKSEESAQGEGQIFLTESGAATPVLFRPIVSRKDRHGTEFSLLALPLGGFAAIRGMHPKEDGSEIHIESGFYSKSPFARFVVLFAGPLFSILLGIALLAGGIAIQGEPSLSSKVGLVQSGMPAKRAGLKSGDRIVSIDGKPIDGWYSMMRAVQLSDGRQLRFGVDRGGKRLTLEIKPNLDDTEGFVIGLNGEQTKEKRRLSRIGVGQSFDPVPVTTALQKATLAPVLFVQGLVHLAATPSEAKNALGGPASVVQQTHEASNAGIAGVLTMAGLLSISLGVMNLLPIPPLDGGQMVVAIVEMMRRGKRLSIEVQRTLSGIGMLIVVGLMITVVMLDLSRYVQK